jgi:DNA-binding MarR family transcriptional regulator
MIMKNLSAIVRCGNIFSNRHLKEQNIGSSEHAVLMFLSSQECVNQEAIAAYYSLDKGTIARTLAHLEEKGLILRKENPGNHREKLICLSPEGLGNIAVMRKLLAEWDARLHNGITREEIRVFDGILARMTHNALKAINKDELKGEGHAENKTAET